MIFLHASRRHRAAAAIPHQINVFNLTLLNLHKKRSLRRSIRFAGGTDGRLHSIVSKTMHCCRTLQSRQTTLTVGFTVVKQITSWWFTAEYSIECESPGPMENTSLAVVPLRTFGRLMSCFYNTEALVGTVRCSSVPVLTI